MSRSACSAIPVVLFAGFLSVPSAAQPPNCTAQQGQIYIDQGRYDQAVREFTCVINAYPTEVEGYRGRIEAQLLLGEFSNAVRDYTRVAAYVEPVHPDAASLIYSGYEARLAAASDSIPALTGYSFARWWYFQYAQATQLLSRLLAIAPNDVYANLFRGSSRALQGGTPAQAVADLEAAIALAPASPDVRYVVSDAYTYGIPDPSRAFAEASLALSWGLDTPRIRAILAAAYNAFGNESAAAAQIRIHLDQVTTDLVPTAPQPRRTKLSYPLVPGRTYEIPLTVSAGETLSITTSAQGIWDTILVLLSPGGAPLVGADDTSGYYAGLDWVAPAGGTYRMRVSSFESVGTGTLIVHRK